MIISLFKGISKEKKLEVQSNDEITINIEKSTPSPKLILGLDVKWYASFHLPIFKKSIVGLIFKKSIVGLLVKQVEVTGYESNVLLTFNQADSKNYYKFRPNLIQFNDETSMFV